jgi:hypothetical protein
MAKETGETLKTKELMDIERQMLLEHQAKIGKISLEIEKIFLENNLTMGDLSEVMDLFNARAQSVFSKTYLRNIKESYERNN